jgi:hypothetical protein
VTVLRTYSFGLSEFFTFHLTEPKARDTLSLVGISRPKKRQDTMSEQNPTPEEVAEKAAKEKALAEAKAAAKLDNDTRSGVGTRAQVGQTRGRSTSVITYEAWDFNQPETLVKTLAQFFDYRKVNEMGETAGEAYIVNRLMRGDNEVMQEIASDPIAEFVDLAWPEDIQTRFRLVVRNYANGANVSIEDAVSLIKPGIDAAAKAAKLASAAPVAK